MRTVADIREFLKIDRVGFIKGLIAAGYVDSVVYKATEDDIKLVRLAVNMYTDTWEAFDTDEFESWISHREVLES